MSLPVADILVQDICILEYYIDMSLPVADIHLYMVYT